MRWLAAALLLLASHASAGMLVTYYDGPMRYGAGPAGIRSSPEFLSLSGTPSGGALGTRVVVDTLDTTVEPNGAGFNIGHCTDATAGNCNFYEAVCASDRYVEFSVTGDIVIDSSVSSHATGTGSSGVFELADCPGGKIRNLTVDFRTAPGAGVQLRGYDWHIDGGADNIVILHPRHRGGALTGSPHTMGLGVTNATNVLLDHPSTAFGSDYAGQISTIISGETNQPIQNVTWQHGLHGWTHMWGPATKTAQGRCFGGANGGATLNDGGDLCDDDTDCQGGVCSAYCSGGTDPNERMGLERESGHLPQAEWVFTRQAGNGTTDGVCQAGTRIGLVCGADAHCTGGGAGSCRETCGGGGTETGPFLVNPPHNFCLSVYGNVGNTTVKGNLIHHCKWRQPQSTVDANLGGTTAYTPPSLSLYDVVGNVALGGVYMETLEHKEEALAVRTALFSYAYNRHHLPTDDGIFDIRNAYVDTQGDIITSWDRASFHNPTSGADGLTSQTWLYFKGNVDRFNTDGSDDAESFSTTYDPPGAPAAGSSTHGANSTADYRYFGAREPFGVREYAAAPTVAAVAARAGATLPCRDAVDTYAAELAVAGVTLPVRFDYLEVGGAQDLTAGCPEDLTNTVPTAQSKENASAVDVLSASGWGSTTATVTNTDSLPLSLHCWISDRGQLSASVRDKNCSGGTVTLDFDATGLADGCYPFSYIASDGVWADRATGTIEVDVGGGSC